MDTNRLIARSFPVSRSLRRRGVGTGKWERICVCRNCNLRGALVDHLNPMEPCPICGGGETVEVKAGRYVVVQRRWFRHNIGYWQLKSEVQT